MINKVTMLGNLGQDPEVKSLEGGATVAKLSVATNENYQDKAGEWQTVTEWHNVVGWGYVAEKCKELRKGNLVYLEGKLQTRKWQDQNGNDKYTTEIVARVLKSLEKREKNDAGFPTQEGPTPNAEPRKVDGLSGLESDQDF